MIAFPSMLVPAAENAGIKCPPDPDEYGSDSYREQYPHFFIFATMQLGAPMPSPTSHWTNAEVIAAISEAKIREVSYQDLLAAGFEIGHTIT